MRDILHPTLEQVPILQSDSSIIGWIRGDIVFLVNRPVVLAGVVVVTELDTGCIGAREADYELLGGVEAAVQLLEALALAYTTLSYQHITTHTQNVISGERRRDTHANSQSAGHID